jgi:SNF family Na+-dependent transporter
MSHGAAPREQWATRLGLILAMAGNAVGLGNFLRFPVQAAQNGGGTFMIPYFVSILLLGIPMMWVEWGIGRHGGVYGHGTTPGMFERLWNHRFAKYLGVLGIGMPLAVCIYYTYVESWTLAYSWFSFHGDYHALADVEGQMAGFLDSYHGISEGSRINFNVAAYGFFLATIIINIWILSRGIAKGIELLAKIAMPLLFVFAALLVFRVFTLGVPDPAVAPNGVWDGFNFIWNPDFSRLGDSTVWLAAAGQIFFTLSIGMGTIQCYASYLREQDDVVLTGLSTTATNEFAEIVLGGSIAIPVAVAYFGLDKAADIGGAYDLAFVTLPIIFTKIPLGQIFGGLWFLLLFFAGITSSVALASPAMSFLQDELGLPRRRSAILLGSLIFLCVQPVILFKQFGFLDEMDFWAGTFGLVVFAFIEVILFAWVFGMGRAWKELQKGADIRIPGFFRPVIQYVTPLFLAAILITFTYQNAWPVLSFQDAPGVNIPYLWGARFLMVALIAGFAWLTYRAWRNRRPGDGEERA